MTYLSLFSGIGGLDLTESPMRISAIAPWFGAKRSLAPTIVEEIGPHRAYWEPFCGSMAVLLGKPRSPMETVNDMHGLLINLVRVVQHSTYGPLLYRQLRRVVMSHELFADSRRVLDAYDAGNGCPAESVDCSLAKAYFVVTWMGMNGVAGTRPANLGFARRFTANGGSPAKRFEGAVSSIPAWRRRLRNVTVLRGDGLELLAKIDDVPGTAIYCDPPYLVKGAKYLHDFAAADHARLASILQRFKLARVIVSYYAHPLLAELYPGWTVVNCSVTKSMVSSGKRDGENTVKAPEVLLINGPSLIGASRATDAQSTTGDRNE